MFEHPQVLAEGLVATMAHAAVGSYRGVGKPIQFGSSPGSRQFGAPTLGQHTAEILSRHGYSDADIDRMKEEGAVR
jgi:formyl-CoA transferase